MEFEKLTNEEMLSKIDPIDGEIIYNTDDEKYYIWKN